MGSTGMSDTGSTIQERILQVLNGLGIRRAHFAGRMPTDWGTFVNGHSDLVSSFTFVAPTGLAPQTVDAIASKLLVITGDTGPFAENVLAASKQIEGAQVAILAGFSNLGWLDITADFTEPMAASMFQFLGDADLAAEWDAEPPTTRQGEIGGITYRIEGDGPPLILLPLFLAPSQWDPLLAILSQRFTTIVLGGAHLGAVDILESRGRARGYLRMMRTLIDDVGLQPGETVLEVGCGTGVLDRWLSRRTEGRNSITGLDINPYLLREAAALLETDPDAQGVAFKEGSGEDIPFPDDSFDLTMSITVIEEVDADRMLSEMARVTRPGGRVAVIARAMDLPFLMHAPLGEELRAKAEAPGVIGSIAEAGCADASLYRRFRQLPLEDVRTYPQSPVFDMSEPSVVNFMQAGLLSKLTPDEGAEWQSARAAGESEGTFFMTWPHHCAVGTKT
jgi:SAM-dependent methyltransferase